MEFRRADVDNIGGTSLRGYIHTTFWHLVSVFGDPHLVNGDKTNAEWILIFNDGTIATIYDWKEPTVPLGYHNWHIGGLSQDAVQRVTDVLTLRLSRMLTPKSDGRGSKWIPIN